MKNYLIILVLACSPSAFAGSIETIGWTTRNQQILNASPDLSVQAQALLNRILPEADRVAPYAGEALFADIDGDGELEMIATVDYSGRGFFTNVVVVQRKQGRYTGSEVSGNGVPVYKLREHLIDADADGTLELVVGRYIKPYEGATRVPIETLVYRWEANHFKESSDAFPLYYREHLIPRLEAEMKKYRDAAPSTSSHRPDDFDYNASVVKTELERAKQRGRVE